VKIWVGADAVKSLDPSISATGPVAWKKIIIGTKEQMRTSSVSRMRNFIGLFSFSMNFISTNFAKKKSTAIVIVIMIGFSIGILNY
jgi:VanZ family protein